MKSEPGDHSEDAHTEEATKHRAVSEEHDALIPFKSEKDDVGNSEADKYSVNSENPSKHSSGRRNEPEMSNHDSDSEKQNGESRLLTSPATQSASDDQHSISNENDVLSKYSTMKVSAGLKQPSNENSGKSFSEEVFNDDKDYKEPAQGL